MQEKFMFFKNFAEAIRQSLPPEKQAEAYKAICEYALYNEKPSDPFLLTMCLLIAPSLFKTDGRKNNGGNHNPIGKNQHFKDKEVNSGQSLVNSGQSLVNSGQSLVNSGQSWSIPFRTETETETEAEKEKTGGLEGTKEKKKEFYTQDFEELWEAYKPVKTSDGHISSKGGKIDAFKAYKKALKIASFQEIKTGVLGYLKDCQKNDRYVSMLSTCLNKGQWEDFKDYKENSIESYLERQIEIEKSRKNGEFLNV